MSENDDEWDSEASYSTKCNTISKNIKKFLLYIDICRKDYIRYELM